MSKHFYGLTKSLIAGLAIGILITFLSPTVWAACGELMVAKGDIKIETGKTKEVKSAPAGTKVCQGDTIIAGTQSRAKVKMEDGNELNISPDSRILLETYEYKEADNKKKVMLNVLYGKVRAATREENMYNDKSTDGQANTFQVKTKSAVAGVRGTDFLTSFDRKTTKTEIVTFRGKVDVGTPGPSGTILNSVSVGAGQKTEALPGAPPAPPKAVPTGEMDRMSRDTTASTPPANNSAPGTNPGPNDGGGEKREPSSTSGNGPSGPGPVAGSPGGPGAGANNGPGPGDMTAPGAGANMRTKEDMGMAPTRGPAAVNIPGGPIMMPPPPMLTPMVPPVPPLVNQQIESGPGRVNISITITN